MAKLSGLESGESEERDRFSSHPLVTLLAALDSVHDPVDPDAIDVDAPSLERLQAMEIDRLYEVLHEYLDQADMLARTKGHVAFKVALAAGWLEAIARFKLTPQATPQKNNEMLMEAEARFIAALEKMGVHVGVESALTPEQFRQKPHLFMATHQGGGLEINLLAELIRTAGVDNFRYVMKDDNVNLPVIGRVIASRDPIIVNRKKVKEDGDERTAEIARVAGEIIESLHKGEHVLFFFEGTRSRNGLIAYSAGQKKWCADLNEAIKEAAGKYPDLDYGEALVVLDTLSVLPVAVEKDPTATIRTNGDCTATIIDAKGLSPVDNLEDLHDEGTVPGRARGVLKDVLIKRAQRYQQEVHS